MMNQSIKHAAVRIAIAVFFVMAAVGWWCGHEPATCACRAIAGAAAAYLVIRIAGKMIVHVLVTALVDEQVRRRQSKG